jgi:Domain of unknown function (DUF397)
MRSFAATLTGGIIFDAKCRCNCHRQVQAPSAETVGSRFDPESSAMIGEAARSRVYNGMPAGRLRGARWLKSGRSSAQGNCVETAKVSDDRVAVRNSRHPRGPALIFSQAEVRAFLEGVKDGDFDELMR